MNFLPKELEDIIFNYKNQLEHKEKFQKTIDEINSIKYKNIILNEQFNKEIIITRRIYKNDETSYIRYFSCDSSIYQAYEELYITAFKEKIINGKLDEEVHNYTLQYNVYLGTEYYLD